MFVILIPPPQETIYARELEQEVIGVSYSMAGNKAAVTMSEGKKKTGVRCLVLSSYVSNEIIK